MANKRIKNVCYFFLFSLLCTGRVTMAADQVYCTQENDTQALISFLESRPLVDAGQFTQTKTIAKYGVDLVSSGHFNIESKMLQWVTIKPQKSEVRITPAELESRMGEQVYTTALEKGSFGAVLANTFFGLFQLDMNALKAHFNIAASEKAVSWEVTLKPCQPGFEIDSIQISVPKNEEPLALELTYVNGDVTSLQIVSP